MEMVGFLRLRLMRLAYEAALAESGERVSRVMLRVRQRTSDGLRHVQRLMLVKLSRRGVEFWHVSGVSSFTALILAVRIRTAHSKGCA